MAAFRTLRDDRENRDAMSKFAQLLSPVTGNTDANGVTWNGPRQGPTGETQTLVAKDESTANQPLFLKGPMAPDELAQRQQEFKDDQTGVRQSAIAALMSSPMGQKVQATTEMNRAAQEPLLSGLSPVDRVLAQLDQKAYVENKLKSLGPRDVAAGASIAMPDGIGGFTNAFTAPNSNQKTDLVTLKFPDGHTASYDTLTQKAEIAAAVAKNATEVRTPAAQVNLNNSQEGKFGQTMGEGLAKEYMGIQNAGRSAADASSRLDYLSGLLDNVETGTGAPTITAIKAGAKRMGMDLDALGIKDDVGAAQAAQVITNQMALDLRSTANGGGMPGAMSEGDRKFLQEMPPGIEKTPEGNKLIIQYWKKMKQREAQLAQWARDYKKQNKGVYDEGFYDYAAEKSAATPLFGKAPAATTTAPGNTAAAPVQNWTRDANGVLVPA